MKMMPGRHSSRTPPPALRGRRNSWWLRVAQDKAAVTHLGLDSEGTGRQQSNLLAAPLQLSWAQTTDPLRSWKIERSKHDVTYRLHLDKGELVWRIGQAGAALTFTIASHAWCPLYDLMLAFDLNTAVCPPAVIPHDFTDDYRLLPPYLLIAPDHGHLYVEVTGTAAWHATLTGNRSTHKLLWALRCDRPFENGDRVTIRFSPRPIRPPDGVAEKLWRRSRRPWLNLFQLNAHENDVETPLLLANNVLSNPAIGLAMQSGDAMLFLPEPVPGINLARFLRHTLDDWFKHRVMQHGNVAYFGKSDTYLATNPMLIAAAWDYVQMTGDHAWLAANINQLQLVADFILRRDQDGDGLTESIHSGNAWSLRDPDRADFYLETINFGHKNAYTNALAYRAEHCMADLLALVAHPTAARMYRTAAAKLKAVYARTFFNPQTGVLAGWISQDGELHDHLFPFVNGRACALGLVDRDQGRAILRRIMARLRELKPRGWPWGVPVNLRPVPDRDLLQPAVRVDGRWGMAEGARRKIPTQPDEFGRLRWNDPAGANSFYGKALYNGATQAALTADLIMGLIAVGLKRDAAWVLEPLLKSAAAGDLQNGLHVTGGTGAEHHDWAGRPAGYEGYLPENWCFLTAALIRNPKLYRRLFPFVS